MMSCRVADQLKSLSEYTGCRWSPPTSPLSHSPPRALQDVTPHQYAHDRTAASLFRKRRRHLKSPQEMNFLFASLRRKLNACHHRQSRYRIHSMNSAINTPISRPSARRPCTPHRSHLAGRAKHYPANSGAFPTRVVNLNRHEFQPDRELELRALFSHRHDLSGKRASCGILCQGRGAAANSAVGYGLGVTAVIRIASDMLLRGDL
jgi:hypothetical protein